MGPRTLPGPQSLRSPVTKPRMASRPSLQVPIAAIALIAFLVVSTVSLGVDVRRIGSGGLPLSPAAAHHSAGTSVATATDLPVNPDPTLYGNATFVLPGYTTLASYVDVPGAASNETNGAQVPIVSWTADGVFYVNVSDDLVFDNFASGAVTRVAAWTPLYEDLMLYNGVANTEYITQDGSEIYAIGCPTSCQADPEPSVEIEVANVSTGAVWTYTFTGLTFSNAGGIGNTEKNVQGMLIGQNGSDDEAVVVDETGVVYGVPVGSPARAIPRELAILVYFEANNLDWMPSIDSFINEQAGGSRLDQWQQLVWNGNNLSEEFAGAWASGIKSAFADAGGYNITAGEWSLTAGNCSAGKIVNGYLPIVGGIATGFVPVGPPNTINTCPYGPPHPPLNAGGNLGVEGGASDRVPITAAGPFVAEAWNNTSAILNPVTGEWSTLGTEANPGIFGPSGTFSTANLFHNGSYLVSPRSGSCEITCSLHGSAGASVPGTEWWLWNTALPEFPYAPTSPLAEPSAPPAPALTLTSTNTTSVTATWAENTSGGPLLNLTLCWTTNGSACEHWVPLMPWADSYTITGLSDGARVSVEVFALNYHYFGPAASASAVVGPPAPTFLGLPAGEGYLLVAGLGAVALIAVGIGVRRGAMRRTTRRDNDPD